MLHYAGHKSILNILTAVSDRGNIDMHALPSGSLLCRRGIPLLSRYYQGRYHPLRRPGYHMQEHSRQAGGRDRETPGRRCSSRFSLIGRTRFLAGLCSSFQAPAQADRNICYRHASKGIYQSCKAVVRHSIYCKVSAGKVLFYILRERHAVRMTSVSIRPIDPVRRYLKRFMDPLTSRPIAYIRYGAAKDARLASTTVTKVLSRCFTFGI